MRPSFKSAEPAPGQTALRDHCRQMQMLTYWGWDKMAAISQTTYSDAFFAWSKSSRNYIICFTIKITEKNTAPISQIDFYFQNFYEPFPIGLNIHFSTNVHRLFPMLIYQLYSFKSAFVYHNILGTVCIVWWPHYCRQWYIQRVPQIIPTGGRLNKKDGLTRYGDSHVKDKTS